MQTNHISRLGKVKYSQKILLLLYPIILKNYVIGTYKVHFVCLLFFKPEKYQRLQKLGFYPIKSVKQFELS